MPREEIENPMVLPERHAPMPISTTVSIDLSDHYREMDAWNREQMERMKGEAHGKGKASA